MWFNSIVFRYRACVSGLGHFRNEMARNILFFNARGHKRAFLWLFGGEIYPTETQNKVIFLGNWYKTGQNVTLTVSIDLLLGLSYIKW